jgi:hypothetical protein
VQTTNVCEDCHSVNAWTPVTTVDHIQVIGTCNSCHDGITATGKHPTHIASGNNCDDCHTTVAWLPANFDHANILSDCFSCHNGVDATGKGSAHARTTNVCEDCHSPGAWIPVISVDHTQVLGTCSSCHNGVVATGKPATHFLTSKECSDCHTTAAWVPSDFQHTMLGYEPLDHATRPTCRICHESNSETVIWRFPTFQPDCAGCHAGDYELSEHEGRTVSQNRNCAGLCHENTPEHRISSREW